MLDSEYLDDLAFVLESLAIIQGRMKAIRTPDDFINSDQGILYMDGIAMRLQAITEKVKRVEKNYPGLFLSVGLDPQPIIRFRDFISHHYEEADYEVLFDICQNYLPVLEKKVIQILNMDR